jgi:hypothetical protein
MNANVMHVNNFNIIKDFSIFILFIFIYFLAVTPALFYFLAFITELD